MNCASFLKAAAARYIIINNSMFCCGSNVNTSLREACGPAEVMASL